MKARKFLLGAVAAVMSLSIAPVAAAEVEVAAGADFVSSYVWRGAYQGQGAAFQPGASVSVGGFTVGTWGSTSFSQGESAVAIADDGDFASASFSTRGKELDFYVAYEVGGLSIGFTDYWWEGEGSRYFTTAGRTSHYGEVNLSYTFGEKFPLTLAANTFVYGGGDLNDEGKQAYSTYFRASYPFAIGGFDFEAGLGMISSKYKGCYANDYSVVQDVNLCVSYDVQITEKFSLPLFVDTIFSPACDDAHIVFGFSLNM